MYKEEKLDMLALTNPENDHDGTETEVHVDEHEELHPIELPHDEEENHPEHK